MLMHQVMRAGAIALCAVGTARAGFIFGDSIELGEQDFEDGAIPDPNDYLLANLDEESPFNRPWGLDSSDSDNNFDVEFSFDLFGGPKRGFGGETWFLTLGLYDHDSSAAGEQIAELSVNWLDLTVDLNELVESKGGGDAQYNVYTIELPYLPIDERARGDGYPYGSIDVRLRFGGGGLFGGQPSPSNGGAIDFARLWVPAPGSAAVLLGGMGAVSLRRRR